MIRGGGRKRAAGESELPNLGPGRLIALNAALAVNPRELIGTGGRELGTGLSNPGDRKAQVLVLHQCLADEDLKVLIFEEFPPAQIGQ